MKPLSFSRRAWQQFGFWLFGLLFLICNSFRRFGMQRVPWKGPLLIISNHESVWDPPLVGITVSRPISYMARKTLFKNWFLGGFITRQGGFPVDLEGIGLDGIKETLKRFQDGEAVLVFPEGTRTTTGEMREFMKGIVLLVRKAKVPVLPFGLAGAFNAWPPKTMKPSWSPLWSSATKASLCGYAGEIIPPEKLLAMKPDEMLEYLHAQVAEARKQAYLLKRK